MYPAKICVQQKLGLNDFIKIFPSYFFTTFFRNIQQNIQQTFFGNIHQNI